MTFDLETERSLKLSEYLQGERGRSARVAKAAGISAAYLSQIAAGMRPCPANRAPAIEQACGFEVRRWDLCQTDWQQTWPELVGTEGAWDGAAHHAHQHHRPGKPTGGPDMRLQKVVRRGAPPPPVMPSSGNGSAGLALELMHPPSALELLEGEILRVAAQAAEEACRKKEMEPTAAALAVVDAYHAARLRLTLGGVAAHSP